MILNIKELSSGEVELSTEFHNVKSFNANKNMGSSEILQLMASTLGAWLLPGRGLSR